MSILRQRLTVSGQVQGVGFRPFVFRLAAAHALSGLVRNTPQGVAVEVQGTWEALEAFVLDLREKLPPLARIVTLTAEDLPPVPDETGFSIAESAPGRGHNVLISPDAATCPDCLAEMNDPADRRFEYPFTNCTNCGPRWTITRAIPYDRPVTSMACFPMCPECEREYHDPADRRFHAQPNACPVCGPKVWLTDRDGAPLAEGPEALGLLARELAAGKIAAIKGLGGFHLSCDAADARATAELRRRKQRPAKPLAVMVPDLDAARRLALVSPAEEGILAGVERPIVLLAKAPGAALSPDVAPDTDFVGLMLPYTPLHHVLLRRCAEAFGPDRATALVMTSGNRSSEPICLGNREALRRLGHIADVFLLHNRDILVRTDDSVLRVHPDTGLPLFLRRARGFTPAPVFLAQDGPTALGLGPELKCSLCLTKGPAAFVSQHIGDMENLETMDFHREVLAHLEDVLQVRPEIVVHDLHPDYMTTPLAAELAAQRGLPRTALQHHFAHIHAALAENRHQEPALGLALDGTGYGLDGTIWGGECLFVDPLELDHQRLAHFTPFRLPGGEAAVREPWRIAQSLLWDLGLREPEAWWPWRRDRAQASDFLPQVLERGLNSPVTTSCGRLFDGVSALLGLCPVISYEGQAAILLEKAQDMAETRAYPCPLRTGGDPAVLDTLALFRHALDDLRQGAPAGVIARRFHLGLVQGLADLAAAFGHVLGIAHVALSGGVMQNLTLARELPQALAGRGLVPLVHTQVPPNDGCISLGQAVYGQRLLELGKI